MIPKIGSSFYVTDANGDRYEATLIGWHCCHGMSVRDEHHEHCKTKHGVSGILGPLYSLTPEPTHCPDCEHEPHDAACEAITIYFNESEFDTCGCTNTPPTPQNVDT